eukprot:6492769-Amphidinium_carterae.3
MPIASILLGQIDGRTIVGLRKCVDRLAIRRDKVHEHGLLKRFKKQCDAAQALAPEHYPKIEVMCDEDLNGHLSVIMSEVVDWPQGLREVLVQRQVAKYCDANNVDALLPIINPLSETAFNPLTPTLSGLGRLPYTKLASFQKVIFGKVILSMIYDGEPASKGLLELCSTCLASFDEADLVSMDSKAAILHDECCTIWRSLLAIGRDTLDTSTEDVLPT